MSENNTTTLNSQTKIIDGKLISLQIQDEIAVQVTELKNNKKKITTFSSYFSWQ